MNRCFACDRKLGKKPTLVSTRDGQTVYVGRECLKHVEDAGEAGYQPPTGGPRLYSLDVGEPAEGWPASHYNARRRTRQERLEAAADAGFDTHEDYRGER